MTMYCWHPKVEVLQKLPEKFLLSGDKGNYEIEIDQLTWQRAVIVAAAYGWDPMGPPSPITGGANTITSMDAHTFAEALEKALPDIPDKRLTGINEEDLPLLEYFAAGMKDVLMEIIEFSRRGEFVVDGYGKA